MVSKVVINGALAGLVSQNASPTIQRNRNRRFEKEGGCSDWETTLPLLMYVRRGGGGGARAAAVAARVKTILGSWFSTTDRCVTTPYLFVSRPNESNLVDCWQSASYTVCFVVLCGRHTGMCCARRSNLRVYALRFTIVPLRCYSS